jgi:acyl carrier protein
MSNLTDFEREIAAHLVEALNLEMTPDEIDPDAALYKEGLGLDSIDLLELSVVLSKRYGIQLKADDPALQSIFQSLRSLAATVAERRVS